MWVLLGSLFATFLAQRPGPWQEASVWKAAAVFLVAGPLLIVLLAVRPWSLALIFLLPVMIPFAIFTSIRFRKPESDSRPRFWL